MSSDDHLQYECGVFNSLKCSANDSRHTHDNHHPQSLEDININMKGSVDPVIKIVSLWKCNAANIE